jgi:NodT family efflux transporter outer membrane factor (OMF) lipoprotein
LNQLIGEALTQNPTLQAVQERVSAAKSQATIVRSDLFPLLYFDASDQWQYLSENGLYRTLNPSIPLSAQLIDFSLSFSYEFDFWGKYRNLYQAALGREQAARAEEAQVELMVSAALAQSYFALKTNTERASLYRELYEVRREVVLLQQDLLAKGILSALPPLLAEEGMRAAKQSVEEIEKEIALDAHVLNILAGRGPDTPLELVEPLKGVTLSIPHEISMGLLSRRPDLMAQIWRVDALAHEVGAAKAEYYPNINLGALLGFQSVSWAELFKWASRTIGALPGLSLPLYTAGAIGAGVDLKRAQFNEAVYQYNELILRSCQQVADWIAVGKAVVAKQHEQAEIVQRAERRYALTRLRQRQRLDSALESLARQEECIVKKLEAVQLLYDQYVASVNLVKALGGGYTHE